MPQEKSAGAIILFKNEEIEYLLLQYASKRGNDKSYWDLPKGHVEKGETEVDTVKREVKEETGLSSLEFIKGFRREIKYFFRFEGKTIFKIVAFYLAEVKSKEIAISEEHLSYTWLPYKQALDKLTFKNAKDILEGANNFLKQKNRT